jgi:hypothetical protein
MDRLLVSAIAAREADYLTQMTDLLDSGRHGTVAIRAYDDDLCDWGRCTYKEMHKGLVELRDLGVIVELGRARKGQRRIVVDADHWLWLVIDWFSDRNGE